MNEKFINVALEEAKKAYKKGEVPVGAVIVKDGKVISKAHNKVEQKKNAILHAEIIAITKACKKLKNWRLNDCELYVTLQPCNFCMNAIELCRIKKVYFMQEKDKEIKIKLEKYKHIEDDNKSLYLIQKFFKDKRKK